MHPTRRLRADDIPQLIAVYREAVLTQAAGLYTPRQIAAWAGHAGRTDGLVEAVRRGYGLASCAEGDPRRIEAFAVLEPLDRLSLLYCRGRSSRQGRASSLLSRLEDHARAAGCARLRTEASVLSRPLLERRGWTVEAEEWAELGGVGFRRWRMIRILP